MFITGRSDPASGNSYQSPTASHSIRLTIVTHVPWSLSVCLSVCAPLSVTNSKLKIKVTNNTRSQEIVDVCLEMFNCLLAEETIAICKRKFLNKFSVINNVLCQVFVVIAKKELESC